MYLLYTVSTYNILNRQFLTVGVEQIFLKIILNTYKNDKSLYYEWGINK